MDFSPIQVFDDSLALSRAAAELLANLIHETWSAGQPFSLVLCGGGTPQQIYRLLGQPPYSLSLPWSSLHVFWGDERCVPPTDPESNFAQAHAAWLRHVPLPAENIHRIKGELGGASAAAHYTEELRLFARDTLAPPDQTWPNFSAVLLGLGEDGHTASLFPGAPHPAEDTQPVLTVNAHYQDRPAERVTLTPLVFNGAQTLIGLVTGAAKAPALAAALQAERDPVRWPIHRLRPSAGQLLWLVDRAAASRLDHA